MKPSLCPYAEVCKESEKRYAKCASCIYSKKRSYWRPVKEKKPKKTPKEAEETPKKV